jgi:DNA modification methylase
MTITTIQGDCIQVSNQIKNNSIDLLLTDPPYNISSDGAKPVWLDKDTGKNKNSIHSQQFSESFEQNWDDIGHDEFIGQITEWSKLWYTKIRKGGTFAVFISDQYISYLWHIMKKTGFEPKRIWTWKKPAAVPFNRSVNPVSACEYILWGIKPGGKRTFNSNTAKDTIVERYSVADKISSIIYKLAKEPGAISNLNQLFDQAKKEVDKMLSNRKMDKELIECVIPNTIVYSGGLGKNKIHPTEKPVELLEYFVSLLSNPGDTILDTFAGSGSTGVASYKLKRNCILIERDVKMYDKMKLRINTLTKLEATGLFY